MSGSFSEEEIERINELRHRLDDLKEDKYGGVYLSELSTMWRYVLSKSRTASPMDESEELFRTSVQWRKDIQIELLIEEWRGGNSNSKSSRATMGDLCFYGTMLPQRSHRGGPVLVERLGKLDLPGLYGDDYAFQSTSNSYIVYLEECWNLIRAGGTETKTGATIILDITGCGLFFLSYLSVLTNICSAGIMRYPEISEQIFIINAGWMITTLWAAVKPLIPPRTEEKLKILGTNYQEEVARAVYPDNPDGMAALESILTSNSLPIDSQILSVSEAYDITLQGIIDSHSAIEKELSDETNEFLLAAKNYIQTKNASNLAHQLPRIESLLKKR